MKPVSEITVNVDELLSVNKYEVDEENAHIELVEDPSDEEFRKLVLLCPAALRSFRIFCPNPSLVSCALLRFFRAFCIFCGISKHFLFCRLQRAKKIFQMPYTKCLTILLLTAKMKNCKGYLVPIYTT